MFIAPLHDISPEICASLYDDMEWNTCVVMDGEDAKFTR